MKEQIKTYDMTERNRERLRNMHYFTRGESYISDITPHFDDLRAQRITLNTFEHICTASMLKLGTRVHINRPAFIDGILFETGRQGTVQFAGYEETPTRTNVGSVVRSASVQVVFDVKDERMYGEHNVWVVPLTIITPQGSVQDTGRTV